LILPNVIGGTVKIALDKCKRLGASKYLIAESDEKVDASFFTFGQPTLSVITILKQDHLEAYQGDFTKMKNAYVAFPA